FEDPLDDRLEVPRRLRCPWPFEGEQRDPIRIAVRDLFQRPVRILFRRRRGRQERPRCRLCEIERWLYARGDPSPLLVGGFDGVGSREVIDTATGAVVWSAEEARFDENGNASKARGTMAAAFSPVAPILAIATTDGRIELVDAKRGTARGALGERLRAVDGVQ